MRDMMNVTDIAFPNLGIYLENVPKSFSVFGFSIALYGVLIGTGMLMGILLADRRAKASGQNPDTYWELALWGIPLSVVGARIFYVLFEWEMYRADPISVFHIRNGGLAIYGGVITAAVVVALYAKLRKQNALQLGDTAAPSLLVGQIIGRLGNFTNREVFGEYTDSLLAMRLPVEAVRGRDISENISAHMVEGTNYIQVHPTFLYEMLWNLLILALLLFLGRHKRFQGEISLLYLGGYGLGRFFLEGIRTDQLKIPGTMLPVNQILGLALFLLALAAEIFVVMRKKTKGAG
ncbi:MAG: prolipoprotein diacylglyceryl transferase [Clostridium sp.]|nr:prolipoprotein diacylglyceryl transferase [Clostridium sp.]